MKPPTTLRRMSFAAVILAAVFCFAIFPSAHAVDYITDDCLGAEIYFVDSIQIQDAVVFRDKKSGYKLINSRSKIADVRKTSSKSIEKLLAEGWALVDTEPIIFYFITNEKLKNIRSKFLHSPDNDIIDETTKHLSGKYETYQLSKEPACYVLFMIKGDYFNYINTGCCLDCEYDKKLKFKNKYAFYPIVVPLY